MKLRNPRDQVVASLFLGPGAQFMARPEPYQLTLRRQLKAKPRPSNPVPSKASEPGSGTATGERSVNETRPFPLFSPETSTSVPEIPASNEPPPPLVTSPPPPTPPRAISRLAP